MPALLNAHCHLELSHLRGAIPPGLPFTEWLERIVHLKRERPIHQAQQAARIAIAELRASGVGAILDIDSMGIAPAILAEERMPAMCFTEMIRFDPATAQQAVDLAVERQATYPSEITPGLSPHAPYSTTPELLRAAKQAADARGQWLCIHAAETPEETDLLLNGRGALRGFLDGFGLLPKDWRHPRLRPVEYLDSLGILGPRTLLVHVNDVTDAEIQTIARRGCPCVVCPGTHVYFGRGEFPIRRLMDAGVKVLVGTDSLASNEGFDFGRELEMAAKLSRGNHDALLSNNSVETWADAFGIS